MPRKGRTAADYTQMTTREHIFKVPDMYVGSVDRLMRSEWIFDIETKKMRQVEMDLPEAVKRVTLEIISNAGDNSYFSRTEGVDPGIISFKWDDEGYLTIRNGGLPIPVEPYETSTPERLVLAPETIFSEPRTSTNYDESKERIGCGRNGYGSKLTNIFSKHFIVAVGDSGRTDKKGKKISGQEYAGEWKENMTELGTSAALPGFDLVDDQWVRRKEGAYDGESYVQVSWLLDFGRFKMRRNKYTKEELGLFCRYILEFSLTCGVAVEINGELHDYRHIRDFAKLFYKDELVAKGITHFCADPNRDFPGKYLVLKTDKAKEEFIGTSKFIPESQILLLDTPDDGQVFSYANGLITLEGGVHVDKLTKELFGPIIKDFNAKHKDSKKLTMKDIKPHVTIFLVCRLVNTKYNSQSKTKLESPTPHIRFHDSHIKTILGPKWSLTERLENAVDAKNLKGLAKSDGKKTAHIDIEKKNIDANEAGKSKSQQCALYVVEGLSAFGYPKKRLKDLPGGKDLNGVYPLQGKPMNVTTHNPEKVAAYKEFKNIKQMLGLKQDMDYSSDANFKTLRYGQMIIATDADSDGMHILGLVINLFHKFWPALFDRGFVRQLITPVVRVFSRGKVAHRFYDELSFMKWFQANPGFKGEIKYYKGLGSSSDEDIKDDVTTAPVAILEHDEDGRYLVDLAFDKTKADERKDWIQRWRKVRDSVAPLEFKKGQIDIKRTTGNMMGTSFPPYMIDNLFRSIPSFNDGLKKAQRQVLYYALNHYKYGNNYVEGLKKGEKLVSFGAGVISYSKYHHGDKSLNDTVMKMTRSYCGSNNLQVFRDFGIFGTRDGGGKDASDPRYVEVSFPWWYQHAFIKEMVDLVPRREVDGELAEPLWIPCDIPLGLINGSQGVATGWSTYLPSHHPIAVIDWILARLKKKTRINPLVPYFNGFKGEVDIKIKNPLKNPAKESGEAAAASPPSSSSSSGDETEDDDEKIPEFIKGRGFVTRGVMEEIKNYEEDLTALCDVRITEIPVSTSISDYLKFIKTLRQEGKIKDFRDMSTEEVPDITIYGIQENRADIKYLKLEGGHPLTNMVMIDDDGIPHNYDSVETILAKYILSMVDMYDRYKKYMIGKDREKISELDMELRIILAYLAGELKVHKRTDDQVDADLSKLGLDKKIFDKINLRNLTQSRVDALKAKIAAMEQAVKELEAKTPESLWSDRLTKFRKEFIRRKIYPSSYEDTVKMDNAVNMIVDGELTLKKAHIKYM